MGFGKDGESSLGRGGPGRILIYFVKKNKIKIEIWILYKKKIKVM